MSESPVIQPDSASPSPEAPQAPGPETRLVLDGVPPEGPKGPKKRWSWTKRILVGLAALVLLGVVGAAGGAWFIYAKYSDGLPDVPTVKDYRPPVLSEFWTDDRALAGEFYDERRKVVPYERIPKKLVQAFIAAEDSSFFDHPGMDFLGTARAAFKTYVLRTRVQGGSTLTQQAAKAVLVSVELGTVTDEKIRDEVKKRLGKKYKPDVVEGVLTTSVSTLGTAAVADKFGISEADVDVIQNERYKARATLRAEAHARATEKKLRRKIREAILAFRLEHTLTKEDILYLYLNNVYLGHHSYGVQSAAENYFRKDVSQMTLGEMSLLAGLPAAPSAYSPFVRPDSAKKRRSYVLKRMHEEGMITEAQQKLADEEAITVYPVEDVFHDFMPFVAEQTRREIVQRYGNERLLKDGLKVYMTVDGERQRAAQVAMLDGLLRVDKRQGFIGPLFTLETEAEKSEFTKKIAKKLGDEKLTEGQFYVGFVERLDNENEVALVNVGGQVGKIPLLGMRWAREVNPEKYYPSALISHVKQALGPGDVIVVKCVKKDELEDKDEPKLTRMIPSEGPYLTLEQEATLQGALVSVDPARGYVQAMVGGYDFDASEYNRAFQACRQPGSSFKPIVYSAALEKLEWGVNHILVDAPIVTDSEDTQLRWKPENYDGGFKGDVLLRTALVNSMNIPAIKTLQAVGVKEAAAWAHQLGITTRVNEDLSMALGGSCVHLWDLTGVYATMNQGGRKYHGYFVRKVEDRFGRTLEDHTAHDDPFATFEDRLAAGYARLFEKPEQVMQPQTAFLITHLMNEVVLYGTGAPAQKLGKPAAGKTGTTNDSFDTWFMGFTKDLVTGVWLGYDHNEHPLGRFETGGRASLPIWVEYMKQALGARPQPKFDDPPDDLDPPIISVRIDPDTGQLAAPDDKRAISELFIKGTEPTEVATGKHQVDPGMLDLMQQ